MYFLHRITRVHEFVSTAVARASCMMARSISQIMLTSVCSAWSLVQSRSQLRLLKSCAMPIAWLTSGEIV